MTVLALWGAVRRGWFIALIGAVVTCAAGLAVERSTGVYWAQVNVVFLGPASEERPNPLGWSSARLVDFASVIERDLIGARPSPHVVSPAVTIVDEGVRSGERVRLPNDGGQWIYNFDRPVIDVQVVDSTPEAARQRMDRLLARIESTLERRQGEAGVAANRRVTTALSPPTIEVHYAQGPKRRALLVTLVVGFLLTLGAVDTWDRTRGPLRRRAVSLRP